MPLTSPERFANLLSSAIELIAFRQRKNRQLIQDEIGYAIGRSGGTALSYWIYRRRIPSRLADIENLALAIARFGGWEAPSNLTAFLEAAGHPDPEKFSKKVIPDYSPYPELPNDQNNLTNPFPFVVGPPVLIPRQFFGRSWELKRIFNVLKGPTLQNVAIVGKPRSGKTSLLHYLRNIHRAFPAQLRPGQVSEWLPDKNRYQFVFVDFQDPRMCTLQGFYYHVLEQLQIPVPNSCTLARFIDAVSQHLVNPAVILMDEIQVALQAPELGDTFWWGLRSLGTNLTEGRLGFILSSQTIRDDLYPGENSPSPFFNIFGHLIELGPLRKEEAYELINSSPDPFNTDDVEWIINTSQCWPALIQLLAMACWTHIRSGDEGHYWRPEALNSMKRFQYLLDSN